jgi:hypothetical protein
VDEAKPFDISKREVWEAFRKVKANQGAAGVDRQSIADFEAKLSSNLYKLWNRLSSGSYFPPPVRRVMIPKAGCAGERLRPGSGQAISGTDYGINFPSGLLWISTGPLGDRCSQDGPSALLAIRLGA